MIYLTPGAGLLVFSNFLVALWLLILTSPPEVDDPDRNSSLVRQAWLVARKRKRLGCGGRVVDLRVKVPCRP